MRSGRDLIAGRDKKRASRSLSISNVSEQARQSSWKLLKWNLQHEIYSFKAKGRELLCKKFLENCTHRQNESAFWGAPRTIFLLEKRSVHRCPVTWKACLWGRRLGNTLSSLRSDLLSTYGRLMNNSEEVQAEVEARVQCRKLEVETSAHSPRNHGLCCPKICLRKGRGRGATTFKLCTVEERYILLRESGGNLK